MILLFLQIRRLGLLRLFPSAALNLLGSPSNHLGLWSKGVATVSVDDTGTRSQVLEVDLVVALVGLVGDNAVVSILPAHNLVTPVSNLVAKSLHGKDGKGLLHLRGQFLDTKQEEGDHGGGRDHTDMIPGRIEGLVQGQWH